MAALDPNPANGYNDVVVIGIDKDKHSQHAIKWAVENLVVKDKRPVFLIHVRTQSLNSNPESDAKKGRAPTEEEMHQLFLPFRGFCARKGIDAQEVVLHDIEVSSALIEYITTNLIRSIVVGTSNHNILTRQFKAPDVPTSLSKSAPDYCAVYVVGKSRGHCVRTPTNQSATTTPRVSTSSTASSLHGPTSPRLSTSSLDSRLSSSSTPSHQLMQHKPGLNAPHSESTNNSWVSVSSDNSGYGTDRLSVDRLSEGDRASNGASPSLQKLKMISDLHKSTLNKISFLDQSSSTKKIEDSGPNSFRYRRGLRPLSMASNASTNSQASHISESSYTESSTSSGSSIYTQDIDAEMQSLRLELQKKMEALNLLQDEADTTQEIAKELDVDKLNTLEEVESAREVTTTAAELKKYKKKTAMEVEHISGQLEEMETVKNIKSEESKGTTNNWKNNGIWYKKYTLEDIERTTDYFSASLQVGEGGYGPVYRGILDHTQVAIKVLRPDLSQGVKQFQQEVEVLSRIKHPNLVLLLGACPEYGCLVYELMDYGSLEDRLFCKNNTSPIPWRTRFKIAAEISTALHYLHSLKPEPLVHRDLKPANILLNHNFESKICDVGLARLVPPSVAENMTQYHMTAAAGTFFYIDPEYQQTGQLSVKSDVYSLGVMLLQIITGKPAMGISYAVQNALEEGHLAEILDPKVDDWPLEEALSFARIALKCCELRKRDRPDLGSEILPELTRLSLYALDGTSSFVSFLSYEPSCNSTSSEGSTLMSQESVGSNTNMDMIIQPYQLRPDEGHSSSSL